MEDEAEAQFMFGLLVMEAIMMITVIVMDMLVQSILCQLGVLLKMGKFHSYSFKRIMGIFSP